MKWLKKFMAKINPLDSAKDIIKEGGKIADNMTTTMEEEGEIMNDRYALEMTSDSWLSKNIRPLFLIVMVIMVFLIGFGVIKFEHEIPVAVRGWVDLAIMFFFGSRGMEKVAKIIRKQRRKK